MRRLSTRTECIMPISSRTPEGEPADCPVCGQIVVLDPSPSLGDAPCPSCGSLLFNVPASSGVQCLAIDSRAAIAVRKLIEIMAEHNVADSDELDSLDLVWLSEAI